MKKYYKLIAALLVMVLSCSLFLTGCGDDDDDEAYYDDWDEEWEDEEEEDSHSSERPSTNTLGDCQDDSAMVRALADTDAIRAPQLKLRGNGEDRVTIMVYMNGSNLESDDGSATEDLLEMINAGSSDHVNILIQTMGTKTWKSHGIAADHTQRYLLNGDGMKLIYDDLGQLDCTDPATLSDFISWSAGNFPADRYELIFWDHGGGPVYGYGFDEWNDDSSACLSLDEIQTGVKNGGVYFDFIGMDCCLMSCLEVCCALYDFCDYMILSEDFEPGIGWYYTDWLKALYNNTSIPTTELGAMICDDMVNANKTSAEGEDAILAIIDESKIKVLFAAWTDFAYNNTDALMENNKSRKVRSKGRSMVSRASDKGWFTDWLIEEIGGSEEYNLSDYYISDMMAVASTIDADETAMLASALKNALVYVSATDGDSYLTGISVTLPYGDAEFYEALKNVLINCGFNEDYVSWLAQFGDSSFANNSSLEDYDDFDDEWEGWDEYDDDYDWEDWDYADEDDDFWFGWLFDWDDEDWEDDDYYYDDDYYDDWEDWEDWDDEDWQAFWDEEDW